MAKLASTRVSVDRLATIFLVFLKLGCTSFGGPIAHLGYFQNEFVMRRKWLDSEEYADLVTLCQLLPGPASSQVGLAIGWRRAGWLGAAVAWLGFTVPSAALMTSFALGLSWAGDLGRAGWAQGLAVAAVAVVAQAVVAMARSLCPDSFRKGVAVVAAIIVIIVPGPVGQITVIVIGGIAGGFFCRLPSAISGPRTATRQKPPKASITCLGLFVGLLLVLPALSRCFPLPALALVSLFYRTGALVFGGGHVVLPLLEQATVVPGRIDQATFLTGYGAAQALPGPLFAFAAYLGALISPRGVDGALLALGAIYLPAVLILFAALPHWERLRNVASMRRVFAGANAAVVGLLGAAFYSPVCSSAITDMKRLVLALGAFAILLLSKAPSWLVIALCACAGAIWLN